jgi:hypothetical protein
MTPIRATLNLVASLVWVSDKARQTPTPKQISAALRFRRIGIGCVLLVPFFVSAANLAEIMHKPAVTYEASASPAAAPPEAAGAPGSPAQTGTGPATPVQQTHQTTGRTMMALVVQLVLAGLYAWYAWFLINLLLFSPPLEHIRWQDAVMPFMLAFAYVAYGLPRIYELADPGVDSRFGSVWPVLKVSYVAIFLTLYVAWLIRDVRELAELPKAQGALATSKRHIRFTWLVVDALQILVILSIATWMSADVESVPGLHTKDLAIVAAFVGNLFVSVLVRHMREGSERQAFSDYVAAIQPVDARWLVPLQGLIGWEEYTVVDIGCAEGKRTAELVEALAYIGLPPSAVIGIDDDPSPEGGFKDTVKRVTGTEPPFYCVTGLSDAVARVAKARVVLYISHFSPAMSGDRDQLKSLIVALLESKQLAGLIWRLPAPGSIIDTATSMGTGDYWQPVHIHLRDRILLREVTDLLRCSGMQPVACDPVAGSTSMKVEQRLKIRLRYLQIMEWMGAYLPSQVVPRVDHWLRQQTPLEEVRDDDVVYVFDKVDVATAPPAPPVAAGIEPV